MTDSTYRDWEDVKNSLTVAILPYFHDLEFESRICEIGVRCGLYYRILTSNDALLLSEKLSALNNTTSNINLGKSFVATWHNAPMYVDKTVSCFFCLKSFMVTFQP